MEETEQNEKQRNSRHRARIPTSNRQQNQTIDSKLVVIAKMYLVHILNVFIVWYSNLLHICQNVSKTLIYPLPVFTPHFTALKIYSQWFGNHLERIGRGWFMVFQNAYYIHFRLVWSECENWFTLWVSTSSFSFCKKKTLNARSNNNTQQQGITEK